MAPLGYDSTVLVTDTGTSAYKPVTIETDSWDVAVIHTALKHMAEEMEKELADCPGFFKPTYETWLKDSKRIMAALDPKTQLHAAS